MTEDGSSGFAWKDRARDRIPRGEKHKQKGNAGEKKGVLEKKWKPRLPPFTPKRRRANPSRVALLEKRLFPIIFFVFFLPLPFSPLKLLALSPRPPQISSPLGQQEDTLLYRTESEAMSVVRLSLCCPMI